MLPNVLFKEKYPPCPDNLPSCPKRPASVLSFLGLYKFPWNNRSTDMLVVVTVTITVVIIRCAIYTYRGFCCFLTWLSRYPYCTMPGGDSHMHRWGNWDSDGSNNLLRVTSKYTLEPKTLLVGIDSTLILSESSLLHYSRQVVTWLLLGCFQQWGTYFFIRKRLPSTAG